VTLLGGLVVVVAIVVVAGVGCGVGERSSQRSAEETVRAFFEARRAGDCERLAELVSRRSRSAGGPAEHDRFVEACAEVVGDYRPELATVEVVSEGGSDAVVNMAVEHARPLSPDRGDGVLSVSVDGETRAYEVGHLVHEGGEWKVEVDEGFLRVGRSVDQTVRAFVNAFNDDDCERLVDSVSESLREAMWSDGERSSREAAVEACATAAGARRELPDIPVTLAQPATVDVSLDRGGGATARWDVSAEVPSGPRETATLVKDALGWKLDSLPEGVQRVELRRQLLYELPSTGFRPEQFASVDFSDPDRFSEPNEGDDLVERRSETGFRRGAVAMFLRDEDDDNDDDYAQSSVALYEFGDGEGARTYAELLADRVSQQADSESPSPRPSVADARAAVVTCRYTDGGGCARAYGAAGVTVEGRLLVFVTLNDARQPAAEALAGEVEEVLHAQLDRL
jgi:hypothetical protein